MPDMEKVIRAFEQYVYNFVELTTTDEYNHQILEQVLVLLKEQEHKDRMFHALEDDWKRLKELLKEQEAVTIKKTKEHGFGVYGGICPKCRNWIQSAHSFCGFCGQAVKWE